MGKEQGSLTSKSGVFHSSIPHTWSKGIIPVPGRCTEENPGADVRVFITNHGISKVGKEL